MSALPQGYDAWKTAIPDGVHCTECARRVDAFGSLKQDHDVNCSQHPYYQARCDKAAASIVRAFLKEAIEGSDLCKELSLIDISERTGLFTIIEADGTPFGKKRGGLLVTARIRVSDEAIKEAM